MSDDKPTNPDPIDLSVLIMFLGEKQKQLINADNPGTEGLLIQDIIVVLDGAKDRLTTLFKERNYGESCSACDVIQVDPNKHLEEWPIV